MARFDRTATPRKAGALRAAGGLLARVCAAVLLASSLASCGTSQVHRSGAAQRAGQPARVSQPRYGATHVVQRGETVYRIATGNGITALDLALWNRIPPPYVIHPGQRLRLYPGAAAPTPSRVRASPAPVRAASAPSGAPAASTPAPAPVYAPATTAFAWRWPADGALLERFAAGDPTRQGVDIGGTPGAPVRAAADGVVVYSGAGLVGYGELVIVKHDEQWLSAYGHNRARLVNEGQLVKAGQQIAEMGRTGAAREMLHFEIRYNGKPVDPLAYLPRK